MEFFCKGIEDQTVYPILIKNNGNSYLTLYYYTERSDSVLHSDTKHILFFQSKRDMEAFCKRNSLQRENDIAEFDFDTPIQNPIDYKQILEKWNLLNTIAGIWGMFFEGDCKKYTPLYNLLFRLNTPVDPIPPTYHMCKKNLKDILKVFRKKDRFLRLFELYQEE